MLFLASASAFPAPTSRVIQARLTPAVSMYYARSPAVTMFGGGPTGSAAGSMLEQRVIVPRGGLVWPHVHAANLMISAVLEFFYHLGGIGRSPVADVPRPKQLVREGRSSEPVFLQGALCEHVTDERNGHEFWVCHNEPSEDENFACRCTVKNGRWAWYVTERSL